jgi:hypothetical protein
METIKDRLEKAFGGKETQKLQTEVLEQLAEIIAAVEKKAEGPKEKAAKKLGLLADLERRCRLMLASQIEVRDGTVALDKRIQANPDRKPSKADLDRAKELADAEEKISKEIAAARKLLEREAVAFPEVFDPVARDIQAVQARLSKADTGKVTVALQNDINTSRKELIGATRKAQKDSLDRAKGKAGQQAGPERAAMLAELKLIHALQRRINVRTQLYGKQYAGEQVPAPAMAPDARTRELFATLRAELGELGARQGQVASVTRNLAGKN